PSVLHPFPTRRSSDLESALSQFQVQFGSYPPSRLVLHESAAGWASDTRSSSAMRRLCPQFDPAARHHVDPFDTSSPLLPGRDFRSEEHTSELQSRENL